MLLSETQHLKLCGVQISCEICLFQSLSVSKQPNRGLVVLSHGLLKIYSTCHSPAWPILTTDVKMETLLNLTSGQAAWLSCVSVSQTHHIKYSKELLQPEKNKLSVSPSCTMMFLSLFSCLPQLYFPLLLLFSTPNSFTASHSGLALCIQLLPLIPLCPLPALPAPFLGSVLLTSGFYFSEGFE